MQADEITTSNQREEVLTFRIGSEHYAVTLLQVQEIRSFEAPTRLANAAPGVRGCLDLRGTIVTVLDVRTALGADDGIDATTATVILTVGGTVCGLVVDAVDDVVALDAARIQRPPRIGAGVRLVRGLLTLAASASTPERTLQLLDIPELLSSYVPASLEAA
ncbi:MAG: chemotaxis protein CheW [Rubrivivax sp.]|nr:MAG: chemotaxis protein CheW [Rubrivivax sp.]